MGSEIKTNKYIWRVCDQYGWALDDSSLREFTINLLEYSDDLDELVNHTNSNQIYLIIIDNDVGYMDINQHINVFYERNYLIFKGIKFKMKFTETDKFIDKLLKDNESLEISKTSDIKRNHV